MRAFSNRLVRAACIATLVPAAFSQTFLPEFPVVDGGIEAITSIGDTVYLGGFFSRIAPYTGRFVGIDPVTGLATTAARPAVNESVETAISDGAGGWFIGGDFDRIGDQEFGGIAHILADGTPDPDFVFDAGGPVRALALVGTTLYVGGNFVSFSGSNNRNSLAAIDVTTKTLLPWNPSPNASVTAIAADEGAVYVAGFFTNIGGQNRNSLAALEPDTGNATSWSPNFSTGASFTTLLLDGTDLYVGGSFSGSFGGNPRSNLARLDTTSAVAESFAPTINASVDALALSGSTLFIGGSFSLVNATSRSRLAAVDTTTGSLTPMATPTINGAVSTVLVSGSTVYVGGTFETVGADSRPFLAAFDSSTGALTDWNPAAFASVLVLAEEDSTIFAGGRFPAINGVARKHLAAVNATTGEIQSWAPEAGSGVRALTANSSTIFVGGDFTTISDQPRNRIASLDPVTGDVNPFDPGANAPVNALALANGVLYVGGEFTALGGAARNRVGAVFPISGVSRPWNPSANSEVLALVANSSAVYVGGNFTVIGGQGRAKIAALDPSTGAAIAGWTANADEIVLALALDNDRLYAGGEFTTINSTPRAGLAAMITATGALLSWNPGLESDPASDTPTVIAIDRQTVFVGNVDTFDFPTSQIEGVAGIDATTALPSTFNPETGEIFALHVSNNRLFVGNTVRFAESGHTGFAAFQLDPDPPPAPLPPATSRPTLKAQGKTKLKTSRQRVVLKGTATDASRVEFKAGKGGFQEAKGSPAKWRIPVRLVKNRTVVKVRATGPGGTSRILKFIVIRQ